MTERYAFDFLDEWEQCPEKNLPLETKGDPRFEWHAHARPSQQVPEGDWRVWLILAGRGFGKTRTGAETIKQWVREGTVRRIALIGATETEVRDIMIEGDSGLMNVHADDERPTYEPSKRRLTWANGTTATIFSAENYEQLRGPQFDCAWVDELAKFRQGERLWDQLNFSLRLGERPRIVVTTTPRPTQVVFELLEGAKTGEVHLTRGTTFENAANLSPRFIEYITKRYAGTTLGRQELEGHVIETAEGALWDHKLIEQAQIRRDEIPDLTRMVVAVDPAVTAGANSDETGIVLAGRDREGTAYILKDSSFKASPNTWAQRAISLFHESKADCIVVENNQGGDLVESIIRSIDPHVPFKGVHATRGKVLRAEPVLALYEQGRVKHVMEGDLNALEVQMRTYVPGETTKSPDRLDALVWAVTELLLPKDLVVQPKFLGTFGGG
jgi:predicted phage terminase large subunit-like protein